MMQLCIMWFCKYYPYIMQEAYQPFRLGWYFKVDCIWKMILVTIYRICKLYSGIPMTEVLIDFYKRIILIVVIVGQVEDRQLNEGKGTLREEIICGRNIYWIYFCNLRPSQSIKFAEFVFMIYLFQTNSEEFFFFFCNRSLLNKKFQHLILHLTSTLVSKFPLSYRIFKCRISIGTDISPTNALYLKHTCTTYT